jgi:hypothetical protein
MSEFQLLMSIKQLFISITLLINLSSAEINTSEDKLSCSEKRTPKEKVKFWGIEKLLAKGLFGYTAFFFHNVYL